MGRCKQWLVASFIFLCVDAFGQDARYMVFFTDKNNNGYSLNAPETFLSPRAIARRQDQGISVDERDLPVNNSYIDALRDLGAGVLFKTRWMNGALVECSDEESDQISALNFVSNVELVAPSVKNGVSGRRTNRGKTQRVNAGTVTDNQLTMLGIDQMHSDGNRGEGVTIAVFDGGFYGVNLSAPFEDIFEEGRFNDSASYDFVHDQPDVFRYDDHGTEVLSVIGAYMPDVYTGAAYKANFQLYITEDVSEEHRVEEFYWLFAAERADSAGADIINSSLGYNTFDVSSMNYSRSQMDGETAVITRAAQMAADRGMVVVSSAGNEGSYSWQIITAPADAMDVLAVGSVNINLTKSSSSSIGPTADGRIKPDVVALGVSTSVVKANGMTGTATGTSLSAPLITGLVAGVWQQYPHLSNREVRDLIRRSASQAANPDNMLGYGIPHYRAVSNLLQEDEQSNVFDVYPNPTPGTLTVRPRTPDEVPSCTMELVSLQGQRIDGGDVYFNWLNNIYNLDMTPFSPGLYILHIWVRDQRFSFKVVRL